MKIHEQAQAAAGEIRKIVDKARSIDISIEPLCAIDYTRIAAIIEKHFAYVADLEAAMERVKELPGKWQERALKLQIGDAILQVGICTSQLLKAIAGPGRGKDE